MDLCLLRADVSAYSSDLQKYESLNIIEKVLLAKRVPLIRKAVEDYIISYLETSPPESAVLQDQFDTVLAGASMSLAKLLVPKPVA